MDLVLARHGDTQWSIAGRHTGWSDIPLTDGGRANAAAAAPVLAKMGIVASFSSPLSRARETAALAGFPNPVIDDDLREWNYGAYEGRTTAEIRQTRPGWELWKDGVEGGETIEQVAARVDRFIQKVVTLEGPVVAFAHGHVLRILASRWLEQPPSFGRHLNLGTAALSVVGHLREGRVITRWNDRAHITQ